MFNPLSHISADPISLCRPDGGRARAVLPGMEQAAHVIVWVVGASVLMMAASSILWGGRPGDLLAPGVGMLPVAAGVFALQAVALLCLGAGGRSARWIRTGRLFAAPAVVLTTLGILLHAGIGRGAVGAVVPGFLAQVDRLPNGPCFAGTALGLALLCLHRESLAAARWAVSLGFFSGCVGLLALLGHLFDAPGLYFRSADAAIAPMGATALMLLSLGAWCAQPNRGPVGLFIAEDAGGASLRHLLPAVVALLPALAWLRFSAERAGAVGAGAAEALSVAVVMIILGGALSISATRLGRLDRRNREAAQDLAALAADLERQVAARTRELSLGADELRREIAERQRAEALFRGVFDGVPDAVVVVDPGGRIALVNGRCGSILGYHREALIGRSVGSLLSPRVVEDQRVPFRDFQADPQPYALFGDAGDLFLRRMDGSDFEAEVALGSAVIEGRIWLVVSLRDISNRLVAQRSARIANERYHSLMDNLPVGVFAASADPDGYFFEANEALAKLLEADSLTALMGLPISRFHADPKEREWLLAEAAGSAGRFEREFDAVTCRGRNFRAALTIARREVDGVTQWDGVLVDVSARDAAQNRIRALNATLARRAEELEAANRELEAFSYSVSHDLRAPLRAIDGFSRIIEQQATQSLDEANRERLSRVRYNAQRMGVLIDDLLQLARVTRVPLRWHPVDLSALAVEIVAGLREDEPLRQVDVHVQPGMRACGDRRLLQIALDNLLGNAWKFTQKSAHARIDFRIETSGRETVFALHDNGAGFDMAHAQHLFGAFQRLHAVEEFPGTGIGLATVQRIIHKHGGRIWAQAQRQQGACFRFTLPREAPA